MDSNLKKKLRSILFFHLDGIAISPTMSSLHKQGITQFILNKPNFHFQDITSNYKCNPGYMNVALRLLASQGWLKREILIDGEEINFHLTEKGQNAFTFAQYYVKFSNIIPELCNIEHYLYSTKPL